MGAQEAREGVFGHQTVDPLLCVLERVDRRRVHGAEQSLTGLSVQVYLGGCKEGYLNKLFHSSSFHVLNCPSLSFLCSHLISHSALHQPPAEHQG